MYGARVMEEYNEDAILAYLDEVFEEQPTTLAEYDEDAILAYLDNVFGEQPTAPAERDEDLLVRMPS